MVATTVLYNVDKWTKNMSKRMAEVCSCTVTLPVLSQQIVDISSKIVTIDAQDHVTFVEITGGLTAPKG